MKTLIQLSIAILLTLTYCNVAIAQDLDAPNNEELNNQKETQTKYHLKHIALFQTYLGYLKKGYNIVQKGLKVVTDIKDGTFSLDKSYIGELKNVKPSIARSVKAAQCLRLQSATIRDFNKVIKRCRQSGMFTASEVKYLETVRLNVVLHCEASIDELSDIITSGKTVMRDDERLARIDRICSESQDRYAFVKVFAAQTTTLAIERQHDAIDIQHTQSLNGIES
jgi:hypothetical protein